MKRLALCLSALLLAAGTVPSQAAVMTYSTSLSGANEVPPNASSGTGTAVLKIDDVANTMSIVIDFAGLAGTSTAGHIHCCTAAPFTGTAAPATVTPTFPGLPLGVTSGHYAATFNLLDASSYNPAFVSANGGTAAGAEAAFLAGLASGRSYLNIHSSVASGGEIRGFLLPEPGSAALFGLGAAGLALLRRRKG
jgi:hypothetical protein